MSFNRKCSKLKLLYVAEYYWKELINDPSRLKHWFMKLMTW